MPHTKPGHWSVNLIGAFIVCLLIFLILIATGQTGGETFFSNLTLTIPILLAGISGIAAMIVGLVAIIKQKERSPLVFVAVAIGALITLWIAAEIIFQH